jgi:thiol-disulfide isomerase/thioredoxin
MQKINLLILLLALFTACAHEPQQPSNKPAAPLTKEQRMESVRPGQQAPNGNLLAPDSSLLTIAALNQRLLVIDFWATWCSPCLREAPHFNRLREKYRDQDVRFITVSIDDEFQHWRTYLNKPDSPFGTEDNYWLGMQEENPFFAFTYTQMEIDSMQTVLVGLPKYVILSATGMILQNDTLKPSSPDFEQNLAAFLNQ